MQGFNYWMERMKFENAWEKREEAYRRAGMTEKQIREMREYDWSVFKSDRRFYERNVDAGAFSGCEDEDPAADRRGFWTGGVEFSISVDEVFKLDEIFGWEEALDNSELTAAIRRMSPKQKRILTLYANEGYDQEEIAAILQTQQATVSRNLKSIRETLEKAMEKADKKRNV